MKIATWNVAYARGRAANERRRAVLDEVGADIWVLTETNEDLFPSGDYVPVHSLNRVDPGNRSVTVGSKWVTIWVRESLKPTLLSVTDRVRSAACSIQSSSGPVWFCGTVLPWYGDKNRGSVAQEVARQREDWHRFRSEVGIHGCVAGDFNVNLGGRHYYGSKQSKKAVQESLDGAGLVAVTDFKHTEEVRRDYGLIDHIAVSREIAELKCPPWIWERVNMQGEFLSDHAGVVIDLTLDP